LASLNVVLNLPSNLREMGVPEALADQVTARAEADHSTPTNPRPAKREDFLELFFEALG
jgi:alcohol dehydrogenase class IV